ncbi:thioredoxin-disulfide reductase [Flavihumibacter solisilvae]|uniref:thioredoxin-disulfide reductase n=1 Tax=Flavihumibacter solisilvae TaxID=1349421 RepID=UPI000690A7D1|nr:thioredoxin-disulfide reductase [Flavihumibacter solisilvae]
MGEKSPEKVQLLIIGSGAAGYTAAIYAARANLKPVLYQGIQPGGQLTITTAVENYPGFSAGIQGPELMMEFEKQAERMGADIRYGHASKVDFSKRPFKVWIDEEKLIEADAVIISTGASAKWLGLESERRLTGHGVGSCAVCDGFFFRGKDVAIVGGGDTAAQDALYLSKIVRNVHMIVRRDKMRASAIMQDRVKATPNITIHWNSAIGDVLGENKVNGVLIHNKNGESATLPVEGLFVAIGFQPNTEIFSGLIDMDEIGYLKTIPGTSNTNIEGIFAAGDVQDSIYRQAITAAGSGCIAALDAERYLSLQEHELTNRLAVAGEQKPAA